jgi:hypothetical protein
MIIAMAKSIMDERAGFKSGGGGAKGSITGPKCGELKYAMQLQIERGIFFILIARNSLKSPHSKK